MDEPDPLARVLDAIDDAARHARRLPYGHPLRNLVADTQIEAHNLRRNVSRGVDERMPRVMDAAVMHQRAAIPTRQHEPMPGPPIDDHRAVPVDAHASSSCEAWAVRTRGASGRQ